MGEDEDGSMHPSIRALGCLDWRDEIRDVRRVFSERLKILHEVIEG